MREVRAPAGERTRILWLYSSSIPGSVRFRAEPLDGGAIAGTVEVERRRWLRWETKRHDLSVRNELPKGFSDADYRVYVTPERDTRITVESRHVRGETLFRLLAVLMVLGVVAAAASFILTAL